MIAPELERYFQLRLEWKLEIDPTVKADLRSRLDELAGEICGQMGLPFSVREFFDATRQAFNQWARRSR